MGFIRDDFGPFSVESRRESFIIHAGYGYEAEEKPLRSLSVGNTFYFPKRYEEKGLDPLTRYQLISLHLNGDAFYKPADKVMAGPGEKVHSSTPVIWCYFESNAPNQEKFVETSFGARWRDDPHPEFLNEDLDDLIAALTDFRGSRS